jgi:hypothetical protein
MPLEKQPEQAQPPKLRTTYSAQDARGAEIILRTGAERLIFAGGLVAAIVVGVAVAIVGFGLHS